MTPIFLSIYPTIEPVRSPTPEPSFIFFCIAISILFWFLPLFYVIVDSEGVKNRESWILIAFFFGLIGSIIYWASVSQSKTENRKITTKSELLHSAMKALEKGDLELAKQFMSEADRASARA